jgi:hypothetical protein
MFAALDRMAGEWSKREALGPLTRILAVTYLIVVSAVVAGLWLGALYLVVLLVRWVWIHA